MGDPILAATTAFTVLGLVYSISVWAPSWFPGWWQRSLWLLAPTRVTVPFLLVSGSMLTLIWGDRLGAGWLDYDAGAFTDAMMSVLALGLILGATLGLFSRPKFLLPPTLRSPQRQHVVKALDARGRQILCRSVDPASIRAGLEAARLARGSFLAGSPQVFVAGFWRRGRFVVMWSRGWLPLREATWDPAADPDAIALDVTALLESGARPVTASRIR